MLTNKNLAYILYSFIALIPILPLMGIVELSPINLLGSVVMYGLIGTFGIVPTFHRYYTHGTFKFKNKVLKIICTFLGSIGMSGTALSWAAIHKEHHIHSDTEKDPHEAKRGFLSLLKFNYDVFINPHSDYIRNLMKDKTVMWFHKYYLAIIIGWVSLLTLTGGISLVYYGFLFPAVLTVLMSIFTVWLSHLDNEPQNIWWLSILSCGEGQHKFHHENVWEYKTDKKWYETDAAGFVIKHLLKLKEVEYQK